MILLFFIIGKCLNLFWIIFLRVCMVREFDVMKIGFFVMILEIRVCFGFSFFVIIFVVMFLLVMMFERRVFVLVRRIVLMWWEVIFWYVLKMVVFLGMVRVLDRCSFLMVFLMLEIGLGRGELGLGEVVLLKLLFLFFWVWRIGFLEVDEFCFMFFFLDEVMFRCNDFFN